MLRFHQLPVCRFSAMLVNQYCHSTARTCSRRRIAERIAAEQPDDVAVVLQQSLLGDWHKVVLLPVAERSEPEVPVEARLIRRINARRLVQGLRLVREQIRRPVLAVVGALELDLVAAARHHRKQAVLVGNAKRVQNRGGRQRQKTRPGNVHKLSGGVVDRSTSAAAPRQ